MTLSNLSTSFNFTVTTTSKLARGWVSQPNGRGTLDILQSCLITIFLCSWSVLFLNISAEREGRLGFLANKARWMLFTIFFPEVLTGIAAEQWRSACQSVEDFSQLEKQWELALQSSQSPENLSRLKDNLFRLKNSPWTMRHAFFADMGGLLLDCPDFTPFPIDGHQLVYLVEKDHLKYPDVKERVIWDKNKADGFARTLTLIQIAWFFIQSIGRSVQHLALSTFELSTLAFIFCTMNTYFFWRHKPLDVETPIVLPCATKVEDILMKSGDRSRKRYSQTPLDFVRPPISRTSLLAPFWFGIRVVFDWKKDGGLPVKTFGNTKTTPPRGIKIADITFGNIFTLAYLGIHLVGWNFVFPSTTEQTLWRISSLTLLGLLAFYLLAVAFGTVMAGKLAKAIFNNNEETTILGLASLLPRWVAILIHLPVIMVYALARCYIIVESFVNLRALPFTAFASVNWSNFMPHFWFLCEDIVLHTSPSFKLFHLLSRTVCEWPEFLGSVFGQYWQVARWYAVDSC